MFNKIIQFFIDIRVRQIININLAKGMASMSSRLINLKNPSTWEFSGFSQNGEDGIINVLQNNLIKKNNYFIEIGAADGLQNNTSWLLLVNNFNGLMIEGNNKLSSTPKRHIIPHSIGSNYKNMFVDLNNVEKIKKYTSYLNPDLLSLDIDSNDYHIAKRLFEIGFRPKVFVVEYNSSFGPSKSITIKYTEKFSHKNFHSSELYFGASITAWKKLFKNKGYKFITVDTNGVNAFFVDPLFFSKDLLNNIKGIDYKENKFFLHKFKSDHSKQFKLISDLDYETIT